MRYTVYDLLTDIKGKIHGGDLPSSIRANLDEGRRQMIGKIKPAEMVRSAYIEQALYDQVDNYAIPEDVKYQDILDIKELSKYRNLDTLQRPLAQVYQREFDQKNRENVFSINWNSGVKTMSIYRPKGLHKYQHIVINECDSLTENGTWNVGGNVVNLRLDELNHITKKASLAFDINNSSTSGFIENFTQKAVDINDYMNIGALFLWLSISQPTKLTSVKFIFGSNTTDLTTDYFYSTVNQPHDNNEFVDAWNLLKYMLNSLTSVGNPNPKSISYIRVEFTTTGDEIPNCNLDSIVARKGYVYEMSYNSSYCLIDSTTRAWKKYYEKNSDQFPFEEDTYQILMLETALVVQKNLFANNLGAASDVTAIADELKTKYADYKKDHKAQFIEPEQATNIMGRQTYGNNSGQYTRDHHHREDGWYNQGGGGESGGSGE